MSRYPAVKIVVPRQAPRIGSRDFSGGPNLRDAAPELAFNEGVDAWNVTMDERGGFGSRLGYAKVNSTPFTGGVVKNEHYSNILGNLVTQAGADLYLGTTNTSRKTFTTSARAVFADFAGKVYAGHPVDGLFSSTDGITWTAVADVDKPATCVAMAVWQNRLVVVLANSTRFHWSDLGDGTAWTATSFNNVQEKDDTPLVNVLSVPGIDVLGRPGLIMCKRESAYRVNTLSGATAGAYAMIDAQVGTASAISAVAIPGGFVTLSEKGIHVGDGVGPLTPVASRFEPLWSSTQIAHDQLDLFCAGTKNGRVFLSLTRQGGTANNLALEYHPAQKWIAPRSDAMSCYTTYGLSSEKLYGGHPTTSGQVYEIESGGTDDGVAIAWRFQTRWFEPERGMKAMLQRIRLAGRGTGTLTVRTDYSTAGGIDIPVSLVTNSSVTYDSGLTYDSGVLYAMVAGQYFQDVFPGVACKAFSLKFSGSSSTTTSGQQLLGAGTSPVLGAFALYGLDAFSDPLGLV